jgi:hypothetical protein
MKYKKLLKDPSLHFLFIGLVIYVACEFISPTVAQDEIHISSSQQEKLSEIWTMQWGRAPTEKEMELLIQNHIKEEILHRKALAMGLDKDDELVRRRLIQKVSFLVLDDDEAFSPAESQMKEWFELHKKQFRRHGTKPGSAEEYPKWTQIKPLILEMMKKKHRIEQNRIKVEKWKKDYRIHVDKRDRSSSSYLSAGIFGKGAK